MAVLTKTTASPVFSENDAREAIAAIAAAEGLPEPIAVSLTSDGKGVMVRVADRDQVDEWSEMLTAPAVRLGDHYGVGWQTVVSVPGTAAGLTVYCAVAAIKWQRRTSAVSA